MKRIFPVLIFFQCIFSQDIIAQLNLQWQDLGPDNLGGDVRALIFDKRDSTRQTLYAGAMGGGIWKTMDGGDWWTYLGCGGNYAVSCLTQASDGTIYFGTGSFIYNSTNTSPDHVGNGIYRIDSADNIIHLDGSTSILYNNGANCICLAVNPTNADQILAGTADGLFRSNDKGASWVAIRINSPLLIGQTVPDIVWAPDGQKIFADIGDVFSDNLLIRSLDAGNSWQVLNDTAPGFPVGQLGRISIALAPANPDIVYVSITDGSTSFYGAFKSSNSGNSWDTIVMASAAFNPFDLQGWWTNAIAVSPTDSSLVYFGGTSMYSYSPRTGLNRFSDFNNIPLDAGGYIDQYHYLINDRNPDEIYIACQQGVLKTSEALSNFRAPRFNAAHYGMRARDFVSVAAARNGQVIGGSAQEECALIGNTNNQHFTNLSTGLSNCNFSQLDTSFCFFENYYGEVYESNNSLQSFYLALDSNIDPRDWGRPSACGSFSGSGNAAYFAPFGLFETRSASPPDDSLLWIANTDQPAGSIITAQSANGNTELSYTLSGAVQTGDTLELPDPIRSYLFLSTFCGVWMKRHALKLITPDWYQISKITASCFAVTHDGNKIYIGDYYAGVSSVEGINTTHYTQANMIDSFIVSTYVNVDSNPYNISIQSLAVDPDNDNLVIATASSNGEVAFPNFFKSTDGGKTWESKQIDTGALPVYTCLIDRYNSNNYIVGTEHGIWTSNDSGSTWHQETANMCDVPVYQIKQIPFESDDCYLLYAATNSRGLWRSTTLTPSDCSLPSGLKEPGIAAAFKLYPNPAQSHVTIEFNNAISGITNIQIHDITGKLIQGSQANTQSGDNKIELNTAQLTPGTYLVSIILNNQPVTRLLVITE